MILSKSLFQCQVLRFSYDYDAQYGTVDIPYNQCVDMQGSIAFFEAIDPKVSRIETFAGGIADTAYRKREDGWHVMPSHKMKKS